MDHQKLYECSIDIIERNQSETGAFIASPNFSTYAYSWLRDGSFIAVAMDYVSHYSSSARFHRWVDRVVIRYRDKIPVIREALRNGQTLADADFLFTRYSLEGLEDTSDETWGNFQYDGYGTWLWALKEHFKLSGDRDLVADVWGSVQDVLTYLEIVWQLPSFDCWEEWSELVHPHSLSCVYGGITSALELADCCDLPLDRDHFTQLAEEIQQFIFKNGICEGTFVKHIHPDPQQNPFCDSGMDASLLGVIHPYHIAPVGSKIATATLQKIREELLSESGGVYRYKKDTYYGGGTWILLTAWLGWVEALTGDLENAQKRFDWILNHADARGWLPEQINDEVLFPEMKVPWLEKWGQVAAPLLWSHAMYLILAETLKNSRKQIDEH